MTTGKPATPQPLSSVTELSERTAAGLFVYFLDRNKVLFRTDDNALVATTITIAKSKPEKMDMMVKLVVNLINYRN